MDFAGQLDIPPAFETPDGQTHVQGWAADPDLGPTAGMTVLVYADSQPPVATYTHLDRPDVQSVFPRYGPSTGFDVTLALSIGTHTICTWAVNRGPGNSTLLGCSAITVQYHNVLAGHIDSITVTPGTPRTITMTGWVLDPLDVGAQLTAAEAVQGLIQSQVTGPLGHPGFYVTTGLARPDVAVYYPHGGTSGFSMTATESVIPFTSGQQTCLAVLVVSSRIGGIAGIQEAVTAIAPVCTTFP